MRTVDRTEQIGVLLINLGTPSAPTSRAVRSYLKEFLSDTRVVELTRWLWLPILYMVILLFRPSMSAKKYQQIWTKQGSPLACHTEAQAQALQKEFFAQGQQLQVVYAMRYGKPTISAAITSLIEKNCQQIIVLPLYPQYASSSTASALDNVYRDMLQRRAQPSLHIVKEFYRDVNYIASLKNQVFDYWQKYGRGEHLVISFHGVPISTIEKGDPYFTHCQKTAQALVCALSLEEHQYTVAFQSRFGKAEWLKPSTNDTLESLAQSGVKRLDIICPGFVADCLETLEEIAMEGKEVFESQGGQVYHYIPCLNVNQDWIQALANLCQSHIPPAWLTDHAHLPAAIGKGL